MKILAIEFSAPQRSVVVLEGGGDLARQKSQLSEIIDTGPGWIQAIDLVEQALRQAKLEREQIECLAIGLGPGSYTGIRAAIALAQGWQLALGVKLLGLSSVEAVAAQAQSDGVRGGVDIVIDAQRNEFYLARYQIAEDGWSEVESLRLATQAEVQERERAGETLVGPEVTRWFASGRIVFPQAAMIGRLASARSDFVSGEMLEPIYLRETTFVKAAPPRAIL